MSTVITIIINIKKMENRFGDANEVFKYYNGKYKNMALTLMIREL